MQRFRNESVQTHLLFFDLKNNKCQFLKNLNTTYNLTHSIADQRAYKDCEFRYICTDCRVFIQEDTDILSKPLKCKYNPYEATWEV